MASNSASMSGLANLPVELSSAIVAECDAPTLISLLQTSRHFYRLCGDEIKARPLELTEFLLRAQYFPRWVDTGFACFLCLKILPRSDFSRPHTRGKRGKQGTQQERRFCMECGFATGRISPGSQVSLQDGDLLFVCRFCLGRKRGKFCQICTICTDCDLGGRLLRSCSNSPGHIVVDRESPGSFDTDIQPWSIGWRMFEHEYITGQIASPEWFDGPDEVGM
nr:hypothetical protein CFP56_32412 [Quercus suber]